MSQSDMISKTDSDADYIHKVKKAKKLRRILFPFFLSGSLVVLAGAYYLLRLLFGLTEDGFFSPREILFILLFRLPVLYENKSMTVII